jgi:phosphate transport system ATP-binding protein
MEEVKIEIKNLNLYYGNFQALKNINLKIYKNKITSIIGPSGCGKSTLLRCINRMNELIPNVRTEGDILIDGVSIYKENKNLTELRKRVGMVFQRPNPFLKSVFENIAYGIEIHGIAKGNKLREIVIESLKKTGLYEEIKDNLDILATNLSPERQQRLCISRVLAIEPEIILLDEPCSTLDPIATLKIEELLQQLKRNYTIVIVTHNMQQAARISDWTGFMLLGELVEYGKTFKIFSAPDDRRTEEYISGKFG